jgi:hypothetical protein
LPVGRAAFLDVAGALSGAANLSLDAGRAAGIDTARRRYPSIDAAPTSDAAVKRAAVDRAAVDLAGLAAPSALAGQHDDGRVEDLVAAAAHAHARATDPSAATTNAVVTTRGPRIRLHLVDSA